MRLFVSIQLSDAMRDALVRTQNELYAHGVRGRYSPEENLHLTLAFIGEYPDAERVLEALSTVSFRPFALTLEGMGRFDDLWWAGMRESAALSAVVRRVRRALAENDIPFDRKRFTPHITLIRKTSGELPGTGVEAVSMNVESIALMRSDRGRNGMIYTELGTIEADRD